ncbi:MAG: phage tail protein I [bacterium]|nr:phage tail protein I [bacterium]
MDINESNFIELIPGFMKEDEAAIGLANGVDSITDEIADKIKLLSVWNQIDSMNTEQLDELAWELHISWYDKTANLDVKRQIVKDSDQVHAKLGTSWAAEQVIKTFFGSGEIIDWYNYADGSGEPFHFKVRTTNRRIKNEKAEEFLRMLEILKRKSAHMDTIELLEDGSLDLYIGIVCHEVEITNCHVIR